METDAIGSVSAASPDYSGVVASDGVGVGAPASTGSGLEILAPSSGLSTGLGMTDVAFTGGLGSCGFGDLSNGIMPGGCYEPFPGRQADERRYVQYLEQIAAKLINFVQQLIGVVGQRAPVASTTSPANGVGTAAPAVTPAGSSIGGVQTPTAPANLPTTSSAVPAEPAVVRPSFPPRSDAVRGLEQIVGQLMALVQKLVEMLMGRPAPAAPQPTPTPAPVKPAPLPTPTNPTNPVVSKPEADKHCCCEELKAKRAKRRKARKARKAKQARGRAATSAGPTVRVQGAGSGFLWKPISDSDGKLAVLLPQELTGKVSGVKILSPSGEAVATGRNTGVGNGDREHFRFDRQGGAFPDGAIVEITLTSGETRRVEINETSSRVEG